MNRENWNPKPKDDKIYWLRSHCGPGNVNPDEICGFCGETQETCAKRNTETIKETNTANPTECCGGSGFWCYECGLFYPNDACGETWDTDYETASGKKLVEKEGFAHCECGARLFKVPQEQECE